jgi:hypothetical protein
MLEANEQGLDRLAVPVLVTTARMAVRLPALVLVLLVEICE